MDLVLSPLHKTWIFDLDGTIVVHNGYKIDGHDTILEGVCEFFSKIPEEDCIIILTARDEIYRETTIEFLKLNNIRFDYIMFNIPTGERILINDNKPSGLQMAFVINKERDTCLEVNFTIDMNK